MIFFYCTVTLLYKASTEIVFDSVEFLFNEIFLGFFKEECVPFIIKENSVLGNDSIASVFSKEYSHLKRYPIFHLFLDFL